MTCQSRKNNRLEDLNYEKRNHRHKQFSTHEMELQVSRSICTEIQKKSILLRKESRNKRNIKTVMPVEGSRNSRRRSMSRPYTHAVKHLTPNQRFGIYGVSKREKCIINISEVVEYEICIPKPRILVHGILSRYRVGKIQKQ